jgi:hypothetical protein
MDIDITRDDLACFIHSTTLDLWQDAYLIEILDYMRDTNILSKMKHVCIVNTGQSLKHKEDIERKYAPAKVIQYSENTMDFENTTIRLLYVFAKMNPSYKILYMHTKGVSYTPDHVFYPGVKAWNEYMMYSLVKHHEKCLRLLKVYDTVGCNFRPEEHGNGQHYSGNYWWANARYIEHLPIHYLKDKYHPEFWLLQNEPLYHNIHTIENMYEQAYPLTNYEECVQRGFEDNIFYCKVGFPCTGLCNQLYNIANTMVMAATHDGNKVIILDDFLNDNALHLLGRTSVPDVLDLDKMNTSLKPYGITLIYKHNVEMTLEKVEYGLKDVCTIDITSSIRNTFYKKNHLYIPQWTGINDVIGKDPCPQMRKQIYVYYSLNGVPFMETFHERKLIFNGPVEIKHGNYDGKGESAVMTPDKRWLTRINRDHSGELKPLFDTFLTMFQFCEYYHKECSTFLNKVMDYSEQTINVWHVRNESDAIGHWCKANGLSEEAYREKYETCFIQTVRSHISKDCLNIALTADVENNNIIDTLRQDGYSIEARPNIPGIGREMNGVIDLIMGFRCNGVFLGNINPHVMQGSTFSFVLYNYLKTSTPKASMRKEIKLLTINMDNIDEGVHELSQ